MAALHSWKLFLKHLAESLLSFVPKLLLFVDLWGLPSFYTNHVNFYLTQQIYPLFIDSLLFIIYFDTYPVCVSLIRVQFPGYLHAIKKFFFVSFMTLSTNVVPKQF